MAKRPFTFSAVPEIREPVRADAEALAALMGEVGYPTSADEIWERLERMKMAGHKTFVADLDGRVAGFAGASRWAIYESDAPICWVMALAVSMPFRRHGVGRTLLGAIEEWCAGQGLSDIRIHSGDGRGDAHAFYEACGFARTGIRFRKTIQA